MTAAIPRALLPRAPTWYGAAVMEDATDEQIVRAIAARGTASRIAETALCRRFAPRIRAYGMRHLRDDERARELVQVVLIGVIEAARAGRIAELDKVDRFVLGTCRNSASRMRSSVAARSSIELASEEVLDALVVEPCELIDTPALIRCLDTLEARAKQVVWMAFNDECSADEIAATLEITAGNVRVVRHRALHALRRCLDEKKARV